MVATLAKVSVHGGDGVMSRGNGDGDGARCGFH